MNKKHIVLTTTPPEGQYQDWTTPVEWASNTTNRYMPLGILSLATNLAAYKVTILDAEHLSILEWISTIRDLHPDILGVSALTRRVFGLSCLLHDHPAPYVCVGGPHATHYSERILEMGADAVFVGNLADREFRCAVDTYPKGVIDCETSIHQIRYPDRTLMDYEKYYPTESALFSATKRLPMFSSVGCSNRCLFCDVQTKKPQFKHYSAVVDEMQELEKLGCNSVHVLDDNFTLHPKHCVQVSDERLNRGMVSEWSARGQVRIRLEYLRIMAQSGLKRLHVGIESLDNDDLRFFRKPQNFGDISAFCNTAHAADIDVLAYFILGSPFENISNRQYLLERIQNLNIKYPYFNILFPEPQTPYYKWLVDNSYYDHDVWECYMQDPQPNFRIPPPFGEEALESTIKFATQIRKEFYGLKT